MVAYVRKLAKRVGAFHVAATLRYTRWPPWPNRGEGHRLRTVFEALYLVAHAGGALFTVAYAVCTHRVSASSGALAE